MQAFFLLFVLLFVNGKGEQPITMTENASENICGPSSSAGLSKAWEPYKDETCILLESSNLQTFEEAENFCRRHDAHLVSVLLNEKQKFLEEFLKSKKISNNVWIGLKYGDKAYQWLNGSSFNFMNWASGNPKNDSNHCVVMQAHETVFGKWSEHDCTKRNYVLCEKIQQWSVYKMQRNIMDIYEMIKNMMNDPVPVGFIYIELPNKSPPQTIWPKLTWEDVSSSYKGVFFRVVGGNAAPFGQAQAGNAPRVDEVNHWSQKRGADRLGSVSLYVGQESRRLWVTPAGQSQGDFDALSFRVSGGEVRPYNMAIRVWERTK